MPAVLPRTLAALAGLLVLASDAGAKGTAMLVYFVIGPTVVLGVTIAAAIAARRSLAPRQRWIAYGWIFALLWVPVPIRHDYFTAGFVWEAVVLGHRQSDVLDAGTFLFACLCMLLTGALFTAVACLLIPAKTTNHERSKGQSSGEDQESR